jgi:hypothetical protein
MPFEDVNAAEYLKKLNFQQLLKEYPVGTKLTVYHRNQAGEYEYQDKILPKRDHYEYLRRKAAFDPLFSENVIMLISHIPHRLPKPLVKWLATAMERSELTEGHKAVMVGPIADWLVGAQPNNYETMSLYHAYTASRVWHEQVQQCEAEDPGKGYKTNDVVYDFGNGWKVVRIKDPRDLHLEGSKMQNCLKTAAYDSAVRSGASLIFSLRDPHNKPHVTMEFNSDQILRQMMGKQNEYPDDRYIPYIWNFITQHLHKRVPLDRLEIRALLHNFYGYEPAMKHLVEFMMRSLPAKEAIEELEILLNNTEGWEDVIEEYRWQIAKYNIRNLKNLADAMYLIGYAWDNEAELNQLFEYIYKYGTDYHKMILHRDIIKVPPFAGKSLEPWRKALFNRWNRKLSPITKL